MLADPVTGEGMVFEEPFQVITCLWNVFGHVPEQHRLIFLENLRNLLAREGRLYIDVNNRYNSRAYGWKVVLKNMLRDFVSLILRMEMSAISLIV